MTFCVYKVTNIVNGKIYIGKTKNFYYRWKHGHLNDAKTSPKYYFQRAIRKYGKENFVYKILASFETEVEAWEEEKRLIKQFDARNPKIGYNIAEGGLGGNTMTQAQIDAQYAISTSKHDEFRKLFHERATIIQIAKYFECGNNAVRRCARRLGLSFKERRSIPRSKQPKLKIQRERQKRIISDEERIMRRALMVGLNKSRQKIDKSEEERVLRLYFNDTLTRKEIAELLKVSIHAVRGVVERYYASLDTNECKILRKKRRSQGATQCNLARNSAREQS